MSRAIPLLVAMLLSGCGQHYRCIDGVLHERIGATDAWIVKGNECKEIKE